MASILSVGQSALAAAQVGITTTGHNIANANTPGYSRQIVIQGTALAQNAGSAFVGSGTTVDAVRRVYDQYVNNTVLSAQTSSNELSSYYGQIQQINNMFADPASGVSPALQNFFQGVQNLSANPSSGAARQSLLSAGETLSSQFQNMDSQLTDMRNGVNTQINGSIDKINSYAQQIAQLNDAVEKAQAGNEGKPANDLLDQRDQVISDLSKEIKVSISKQGDSYSVFIGNGQPLVVGATAYNLVHSSSSTDPSRAEVGYVTNGTTVTLPESALTGGTLGGLFDFRNQTLDTAQNALGRMAIGLASTFNAQHELGQDQNGSLGGAFFNAGTPTVTPSTTNAASSTGQMSASISNVNALTTSNYQVQWDGTKYTVTRLSDGAQTTSPTLPLTVDGVDFKMTGTPATGDIYLVKPTATGAYGFDVAITDPSKIAAASPIRTAITPTNKGSGTISAGVLSATTVTSAVSLAYDSLSGNLTGFPANLPVTVTSGATTTTYAAGAPVPYLAGDTVAFGGVQVSGIPVVTGSYNIGPPTATLTYNAGGNTLTGFPPNVDVKVTNNGVTTTFAAGTPVTYTAGATISYAGFSATLSGAPADGDTFTVGPNTGGIGDNRNMLLLGALQSANTLGNGTVSYQGAYGQLINTIGNKTSELEATSSAQSQLLSQAVAAQQSVSGVNLDEEATNLLRYQQAYQAAGKVMQIASSLFDVLLSLGQ